MGALILVLLFLVATPWPAAAYEANRHRGNIERGGRVVCAVIDKPHEYVGWTWCSTTNRHRRDPRCR